ncbi:MAG TPA: hypothetical protein VE136_08295 [Anaerolineales bacterium]|jgi:hypothetical protein|nr:hypothetical protein [Anaerolineales bacterium]
MYEPFLDYARQRNEAMVKRVTLEKQLKALRPVNTSLRHRLLLKLSDLLLATGERIRPQENQVYNEVTLKTGHCYAYLLSGSKEIWKINHGQN